MSQWIFQRPLLITSLLWWSLFYFDDHFYINETKTFLIRLRWVIMFSFFYGLSFSYDSSIRLSADVLQGLYNFDHQNQRSFWSLDQDFVRFSHKENMESVSLIRKLVKPDSKICAVTFDLQNTHCCSIFRSLNLSIVMTN